VTPTAFAHWRKEIRDRDARAAATNQPAFVPVHISPSFASPVLELSLPSGQVIRVPPGFDPALLRALVAALEAQPC